MTISLPIKVFLGGLAIIVSLASAAQAGRPEIHNIDVCKAVAKYYGKSWGGSGNYSKTSSTYGCYYYENGKYGGKAYYAYGGVLWTQNANTGDGARPNGKRRFDQICHISGPHSFDRNRTLSRFESRLLFHIKCDCTNKEDLKGERTHGCARNRPGNTSTY